MVTLTVDHAALADRVVEKSEDRKEARHRQNVGESASLSVGPKIIGKHRLLEFRQRYSARPEMICYAMSK